MFKYYACSVCGLTFREDEAIECGEQECCPSCACPLVEENVYGVSDKHGENFKLVRGYRKYTTYTKYFSC